MNGKDAKKAFQSCVNVFGLGCLGLMAVAMIILAVVVFLEIGKHEDRSLVLLERGVPVTGVVKDIVFIDRYRVNHDSYDVLIEYTVDEVVYFHVTNVEPITVSQYVVGQQRALVYDPQDPEHAQFASNINAGYIAGSKLGSYIVYFVLLALFLFVLTIKIVIGFKRGKIKLGSRG